MEKIRFEDMEILPLSVTEELGDICDNEIKERIKKAVDDMLLQSWSPLYTVKNLQLLEWMKALSDKAEFSLENSKEGLIFRFDLIPNGYDNEFTIIFPMAKVVKDAADNFRDEDPETRKRIAETLRILADYVDN